MEGKLEDDDQVLLYVEVQPVSQKPAAGLWSEPFAAGGAGGRGGLQIGRGGPARPIQGADVANILNQMRGGMGRGRAAGAAGGRGQGAGAAPAQRPRAQNVPQDLVSQLTEMGFSRTKAIAALKSSELDLLDAINWLSEHCEEEESFFERIAQAPMPQASAASASAAAAAGAPSQNQAPAAPPVAPPSPQVQAMLPIFDPIFKAIALVALGDAGPRKALEEKRLPAMERDGWRGISAAAARMWNGERSDPALCAGLDAGTACFVRKALSYVTMGMGALSPLVDDDTKRAMPCDPEYEGIVNQFRPYIVLMAKAAVRQTQIAYGAGGAPDEQQDAQVSAFVDQMEAAKWQVRATFDMLAAGVRSSEDLEDIVGPSADGKPDDRSVRLVRTLLDAVVTEEAGMDMS